MKLAAILLLSVLALQHVVAFREKRETDSEAETGPFGVLFEQIFGFITGNSNKFTEVFDNGLKTADDVLKIGLSLVDKQADTLQNSIVTLEESAKTLNVDITDCIQDSKNQINNLRESTLKHLNTNANIIFDGINKTRNEVDEILKSYINILDKLIAGGHTCGRDIFCLFEKGKEAYEYFITVTEGIPDHITKIRKSIADIISGNSEELNKITREFMDTASNITESIKNCSPTRLNPETSEDPEPPETPEEA